jgi:hypothetical protein
MTEAVPRRRHADVRLRCNGCRPIRYLREWLGLLLQPTRVCTTVPGVG